MKRKADYAFWTFVTLSAFAGLTTVFNVTRTYSATTGNSEIYKQLDLFGDVLERVRNDYVEKPDDTKLIESAINGMLSSLDPHSAYLNSKHFSDMQVQTKGEFGGLGIEVTMEDKVVKVVAPIDDTPAARAGVMANDLITHLDNDSIAGLTLEQAVEKMRGKVGTPITLTVLRKGREEPLEIKLTRAVIKINAVRSRAEGEVAYVKISTFNEQTHANLVSQLERLKKQIGPGVKGYIVDLRNNPGGLLDQAISVTDDFIERGVIVLTKGRNLEETQRANARAGDITDGKRIIVLINGGSASASEIVAGALQDHQRALVIGTRSFGKGSVQTIIPLGTQLNRAGAIRLTTARYFTPSGRSIQALGITPDVVVEQELPEELKAKASKERPRGEASLRGHLKGDGPREKEESGSNSYVPTDAEKDMQLQYALKLIRGEIPEPPARPKDEPSVTDDAPKTK
ncbi:MAG: S41 family peptidase [Hyphomicrobiaceae bacterium]